MPKANPYQVAMQEYASTISALVGIDQESVCTILQALELVMLHELYEKGCDKEEDGTIRTDWTDLYVPLIGKLWLYPINRNNDSDSNNKGYTFKSTINLDKRMLSRMKTTYYDHYDFLKDAISDKFEVHFPEEFKSMI